ncbi:Uncharacterised protein [Legionella feeleii]|uniref:Uncharacterized protein n=1 Tax=Legionella feeleii TaxID=453 RepID=A0A378IVT3_9GAMM|nr:Uncharacterised protein [Legionella feeleii]
MRGKFLILKILLSLKYFDASEVDRMKTEERGNITLTPSKELEHDLISTLVEI